jgi:ribose transport system ATP-binding protein
MTSAGDDGALLRVRGLHKSYTVPVLTDVALHLRPGEVHALVGANGAGKSTLSRIISGLTEMDSGEMEIGGMPYRPRKKSEAEAAGVQMVMQELNLVGTLSIAENIFLNRLPRSFGLIDLPKLHRSAVEALASVGLDDLDPTIPAGALGVGKRQLVEIAAALARPCRILILDEPTAALTDPEIELLFRHVRRLRDGGVGILYISHRMEEILEIGDRVTVLRDGRIVLTRDAAAVTADGLVRAMVGAQPVVTSHRRSKTFGDVALRVESLSRAPLVQDVTLDVRQGEILGLAGLVGSGRTETLRAIYGADRAESGIVRRGDGPPLKIDRPRDAVRAGIGMVPEDRKEQGLMLPLSIRINTTLARMSAVTRRGSWISETAEHDVAERMRDRLGVHCRSVEQPVFELSGGNQQKVVMSRWLLRDCDVLLFDEPTRGIDVGAKQTIYELLFDLAAEGRAVVIVSSELRELMAICDRIAVMSAGRLVATFDADEWSEDAIMAAAFSGYITKPTGGDRADD